MTTTRFQKEWNNIAIKWGLRVTTPFVVKVSSGQISVPVLLRDFGAERGMLLVTDYASISSYADELVNLGYGFSCLSEPTGPAHPDDVQALMEMLADWGWSGNESPPVWYGDPTG